MVISEDMLNLAVGTDAVTTFFTAYNVGLSRLGFEPLAWILFDGIWFKSFIHTFIIAHLSMYERQRR